MDLGGLLVVGLGVLVDRRLLGTAELEAGRRAGLAAAAAARDDGRCLRLEGTLLLAVVIPVVRCVEINQCVSIER